MNLLLRCKALMERLKVIIPLVEKRLSRYVDFASRNGAIAEIGRPVHLGLLECQPQYA